ncbi:MAG: uncharacterized protein K0S18_484 [Anaerocolumna sp.]|jgi:diguanylate cyclase (GGDEF)-like protein|nr:uncharacterized protein [Anaerocolumna sp.]
MTTIFIGCLIPYFLGGLYLKLFLENWLFENSINNSNQILHQVNELIDRSLISDMKEEVELIASLDIVKEANNNLNSYINYDSSTFSYRELSIENIIEDYFEAMKKSHKSTNFIFLGTENGEYMEYPRFSPTKSYDPRARQWYKNTIDQEEVIISEPYITNVSNEMVLSFTKRIMDNDFKIGVIGISVKIDELTESIRQIKVGETGFVFVLSKELKFIVSPGHQEWIMKTPDEIGVPEFSVLKAEPMTTFEAVIDGKEYIFHSIPSSDTGLYILTATNKGEILQKVKDITSILIIIYTITYLMIFAVVIYVSKRITKPILEISSAINHMTEFDFNFNHSFLKQYANSPDEIGIVSGALINMHDNFKELMTQVHGINSEILKIDIKRNKLLKLEISNKNPFNGVINSMNTMLEKIHIYINQLENVNHEMIDKNELLTASEEELRAQLEEIEKQREYINYLAFHDPLTGLPNRRRFVEILTNAISMGKKGGVILLDIDDFKGINDTLGHVFGDHVLKAIASRLEYQEEPGLLITRFGGDEFLILKTYDDINELTQYVDKICCMFDEKININETEIDLRFSIGIALFPNDSINVNQLIIDADLAMYAVKKSGKNNYKFFDCSMMEEQIRKSNIEIILRDAIKFDGFKIVYQPQVDIKTGQIIGYEALLRIANSNLSPEEFIKIAENNGTIIKIGRLVTQKVVEQLYLWRESGLEIKPVAINFSAIQMNDNEYGAFINSLLHQYNIDAKFLKIEITENIFLENKPLALVFLEQLSNLGIHIAIDDFGTGYSSLNYMTFLPVHNIKLDRSLSMKFLESNNIQVMNCLISLVHSLGLTVIAEGIETMEQVNKLKAADCDYVQGYYFSKPLDTDQIPGIHSNIFKDCL